MKLVWFAVIAIIFSGCMTPEAREALRKQEEAEHAARLAKWQANCETFGFQRGTNEFGFCMLQLSKMYVESVNRQADREALVDAAEEVNKKSLAETMSESNRAFTNSLRAPTLGPGVHCTSRDGGLGTTYTDCY